MFVQYKILDCIDKSLDDKEKQNLINHKNDIDSLENGFVWRCIFDNFGIDDEKIKCIIKRYISQLEGFAVFGGDCFPVEFYAKQPLDWREF